MTEEPVDRDLPRRIRVGLVDHDELPASIPAQRKARTEADPFRGAVIDHWVVHSLREVVLVLDGGDGHDLPRALDLVDDDFRNTDVPDLALVPVLLDRAEALFERRLRIDPMQVVEIDALWVQPATALLDFRRQHLR